VPSTWAAALKVSSLTRLAGNPCDGAAVGVSLLGADGTRARDDAKSTTKLAGLGGAGFWALKSMANGQCKFGPAATRAGSLDRYRSPGAVAFALAASFAIVPTLQSWEGTWETDPANPTNALPDLLTHRAGILETLIDPIAYPENAPENVANFIVTITGVNILNTGQAAVSLQFNPLAVAEMITATITATGVALSTSTTG
jgi:hypothetical protein